MTHFTDANTEGFSQADLGVLNATLAALITDDAAQKLEDDTKAYSNGINNAWCEGDTVDTLVARFRGQHPTL